MQVAEWELLIKSDGIFVVSNQRIREVDPATCTKTTSLVKAMLYHWTIIHC